MIRKYVTAIEGEWDAGACAMADPLHSKARMIFRWFCLACFVAFAPQIFGQPAEELWAVSLTRLLSEHYREIQEDIVRLDKQLEGLPLVPNDMPGGTLGYQGQLVADVPDAEDEQQWVEVLWDGANAVDLVALIPARELDAKGMDPNFGLPEAFSVELLREDGSVYTVAREVDVWERVPVRKGHPFVYRLDEPVDAVGARIRIERLHQYRDRLGFGRRVAFAELICLSGSQNVAFGAQVSSSEPVFTHWEWAPAFLVDLQTPLGLPELPTPFHEDIGWVALPSEEPNANRSVTLDLKVKHTGIQVVCFYPFRRPLFADAPGLGIPESFRISVSESGVPGSYRMVYETGPEGVDNPGNNVLKLHFPPTTARYLRIEASRLWHISKYYPAFFGFSEIEVLQGERNVAFGATVIALNRNQRRVAHGRQYWSPEALVDGHSSTGRLVSLRQWLLGLDQRLQIEMQLHRLKQDARDIERRTHHQALTALTVMLSLVALLVIILPLRYRYLERRKLEAMRYTIAGDLHDDLGSNLGSIQVLAETAARKPDVSQKRLALIKQTAAESVSAIRDIVWLLRSEQAGASGMQSHLRETAAIMLDGVQWEFHGAEGLYLYKLPVEQRRQLVLFFREALHNVLRHAQSSKVVIEITHSNKIHQLLIKDDGVGMAPELLAKPATLRALKQRANKMNGKMSVESAPGRGTTVKLQFS